jgi:hypothetical protein
LSNFALTEPYWGSLSPALTVNTLYDLYCLYDINHINSLKIFPERSVAIPYPSGTRLGAE